MTEVFREAVEYETVLAWRLNDVIKAASLPLTPANAEQLAAAVLGIYYAIPSWAAREVEREVGNSIRYLERRRIRVYGGVYGVENPGKIYAEALRTLRAIVDTLEKHGLILRRKRIMTAKVSKEDIEKYGDLE